MSEWTPKYNVGTSVILTGCWRNTPCCIEKIDETDKTYFVSFSEMEGTWIGEDEIK